MKLLIVDDNKKVREMMRSVLKDCAEEIYESSNGGDAVTEYDLRHPDYVLMDIEMEGMNGLTATSEIVSHDKQARVIIVTSFDDAGYRNAATNAGAHAYFLKDNLIDVRSFMIDRSTLS